MKRLRLLLTIALFCASTMPAMGQMGNGLDVKPGVRAGASFMILGGDDASDNLTRRTGFMVGGFALLNFEGPVALQPELNYVQKGAKQEGNNITFTTKLDYIEMPVLAKFQVPLSGPTSPTLFAGPSLGFNITAENELEGEGDSQTEDISDDISGTEFGLVVGGGLDVGIEAGIFTFDIRYGFGLSSIDDTETDASVNNQGFMITVGFLP